jgi:predicted NBD/HSP70 family sugar kinase
VGDELGRIAALVSNIVGPEAVVVNGRLLDFGKVFFAALKDSFESNLFSRGSVQLIKGFTNQFRAFSTGAASYAIFSYLMDKVLSN